MRIAIIISGLLRLAEKNKLPLQYLSEKYDVYVCTNKSEQKNIKFLGNVKNVSYIEDNEFHRNMQNQLLELPEGGKILQWQKLLIAFSDIKEHERVENNEYDCIYKIRTDLIFNENLSFDFKKHFENKNTIFMNSDIYFGGHRKTIEVASSFFTKALALYYKNYNFITFNINRLKYCDEDAGKFQWLTYPGELAGSFNNFNEFWDYIISTQHTIRFFHSSGNDKNFREKHKNITFASEAYFLHYLLSENLIVKKIHNIPFRIDQSRKEDDQKEYNTLLIKDLFTNKKYNEMIDIFKEKNQLPNETADFYRDAAIDSYTHDKILAYKLIKISHKIRPHGPYINRLMLEYENYLINNNLDMPHI